MNPLDRRTFLKKAGLTAAAAGTNLTMLAQAAREGDGQTTAANDHIQIALIGAGGQGQGDTKVALQVPGVKLVAVADCYDGRLAHSKELWGQDVFTTRDYHEIIARKDIDAVIVATPDHWH
ncbi:MAG: Gfo/Idh/MocA family oxidoreductase, partial [Granulicella sp.]